MSGWPNLLPVPELYRWLRNEVPGGKLLAPVLVWTAFMVLMVLAGRVLWPVFQPIVAVVTSWWGLPVIVEPGDATGISGSVVALILAGVATFVQWRVARTYKLHRKMKAEDLQRALDDSTQTS